MLIDNKRVCGIDGCGNVGEWDKEVNGKVYRRRLCSKHRRPFKNTAGRDNSFRQSFKVSFCNLCEYCGWEGPCDVHRPIPGVKGGRYEEGNMRSACPNCHRLISMNLMEDKYYAQR